ncbi:MAG: ABC-F family ATP-binding cassette domain-containing protein [Clostridia bacterium]|nr:ABC-F family ATP-binding cassette domain-containing protein [Clostridia bacterium]NCC43286.1 ABC-F family ATP-binding cassette domain-containing protein [Clostridia bacterium]
MIKVEKLSYGYPQKDLYKEVSFTIENDMHCALIGTNGTGKSTLIDLLMHEEDYLYDGKVEIDGADRIGYVSQYSAQAQKEDMTVFQYISQEFVKLEKKIADYCKEMETAEDLETVFERYQEALDEFNAIDGDFYESNIKKQLKIANLQKLEEQSLTSLSAGEFKLVQIIKEMVQSPGLLIMDEPDVYLDFAHLNALRNLINAHKGTLIVITHNRYLLNHCFNKILQLENTDIQEFDGTYIEYNYELLATKIDLKEAEAKEQEEIDRQVKVLEKARMKATMIDSATLGRAVHARQTIVDRLKARKTKAPFVDIKQPEIHFKLGEVAEAEYILALTDYSVAFDEQLLEQVNFEMKPTEHVAIVGDNGTGKTTLLRDIFENKNEAVMISEDAKIQMFSQFRETAYGDKTLVKVFEENGFEKEQDAIEYLKKYGFEEDTLYQKVKELSGGEKDLFQLALISLEEANLLLLDEPTGHLDVYAQIALEEAIAEYKGAVLMVSHDFYTVANCVDYVLFVENNTVRRMSPRKFRQMIYANHFDKDYLILEQEKKELEIRIRKMLQKNEFVQARELMESLEGIIGKMKTVL